MCRDRPFSAPAQRNRDPILRVLKAWLPARGRMLEIGAGTGQHARYFARHLPDWSWLATEHPERLAELGAGLAAAGPGNLEPPAALDVTGDWPPGPWDAVYSANTAHIMAWPAVTAMFAGVAESMRPNGRFFLYGPFMRGGRHHAESNARFDAGLREREAGMGVRDLDELDRMAAPMGLERVAELQMPANNHTLIFTRKDE